MRFIENRMLFLLAILLLTGTTVSSQNAFPRKIVVEEGSGTWCQYCVRGIVGMHGMRERYPDSFIGIVAHYNDPMECSSYGMLQSEFFGQGLPNCVINRDIVTDPSLDILDYYYQSCEHTANVGVSVKASFESSAEDAISITASMQFGFSSSKASYRLAFVLLEDSVHSLLSGYEQANAYSSELQSGIEMGGFENLPTIIKAEDMYYENVARGIYKSYMGTLGSIPTSVVEGETYTYSYTIDTKTLSKADIQDKSRLDIVALIIETSTGKIVNADKTQVARYTTSVADVCSNQPRMYVSGQSIKSTNSQIIPQVFTINGEKVDNRNLKQGIYIVSWTYEGCTFTQKFVIE